MERLMMITRRLTPTFISLPFREGIGWLVKGLV